jgi:hypothetical protein
MAALTDEVCEGRILLENTFNFYHSGGLQAMFTHNEKLSKKAKR